MLNDFQEFIWKHRLASRKDRILLAVSGGIDSMVMAHLFRNAGFTTGIAHCNFCLRAEESDLDEDLVRKYASSNKLQFHVIRFDTKEYASRMKISIQMAARELRYDWFEKIRKDIGYRTTAVAHNMNDSIETVIINLVRGTGIAGLTGIKPFGEGIIRPLLFATRARIEEYCRINDIEYREDRTNAETRYMRNKIRHLVVPVLKELNPSVEESISATSDRLEGTLEILTDYIESIRRSVIHNKGDNVIFSIPGLKNISPSGSLVFELFRPYNIGSKSSGDLLKVIKGRTGGQVLTSTHRIVRNRDELIVVPRKRAGSDVSVIESVGGFLALPFIKSAQIIDNSKDLKLSAGRWIAFLDFEKISFPVVIRKWKKGDTFHPFGMKHQKKLSDYFIDRKYSIIAKEEAIIMESGGDIVWIIGERTDDRFRVTGSTTLILRIECTADK